MTGEGAASPSPDPSSPERVARGVDRLGCGLRFPVRRDGQLVCLRAER